MLKTDIFKEKLDILLSQSDYYADGVKSENNKFLNFYWYSIRKDDKASIILQITHTPVIFDGLDETYRPPLFLITISSKDRLLYSNRVSFNRFNNDDPKVVLIINEIITILNNFFKGDGFD